MDILRKSNISLEEANRELFREEKVDKQVDREDLIKSKSLPTQSTPITKTRGDLGLRYMHPRVHPIRKPPRKLRKKLRKNRINRFSKQYRIDRALEKKLEKAEVVMRMRGDGPGNKSYSSNTSRLPKKMVNLVNPIKTLNKTQTEGKENFINEAVSPQDIIKYRNETISYTKRHSNEAEWGNTSLTHKSSRHLKSNTKNSTLHFENKKSPDEKLSNKREKKIFHSKKVLLPKKEKQVISEQKYNLNPVKNTENKTFFNETGIGSHGNNVTSSKRVKMKRNKKKKKKKVDEGSGRDGGSGVRRYRSVSKGELIRSIRNINDQHVKLALQSALNKDEQHLKNDVMRIKTSLAQNYRPFNLTKVLKELVTAAEIDEGRETFPGTKLKKEILLKRRNNDWDKPLVRVKRLGRMRKRNNPSERTLIRVKRIEDDDPEELNDA